MYDCPMLKKLEILLQLDNNYYIAIFLEQYLAIMLQIYYKCITNIFHIYFKEILQMLNKKLQKYAMKINEILNFDDLKSGMKR